uniref:Uncharacterized protein n=1 Tax=Amphimedon queenslandica TaxID=400682 RepID=A0A1X7TMF9_AMPQE
MASSISIEAILEDLSTAPKDDIVFKESPEDFEKDQSSNDKIDYDKCTSFYHSHELLEQYRKEDKLLKTLDDIEIMIKDLQKHLHEQ